jgi:hypothetical protein
MAQKGLEKNKPWRLWSSQGLFFLSGAYSSAPVSVSVGATDRGGRLAALIPEGWLLLVHLQDQSKNVKRKTYNVKLTTHHSPLKTYFTATR